MKRFYQDVLVQEVSAGFTIALDRRMVKTPEKQLLVLPSRALAQAIAGEWLAQGDAIIAAHMPLTRHANTTLDRVLPDPTIALLDITRYANSDLICYRAEFPPDLVSLQIDHWEPLLLWARQRYGIDLHVQSGLMPAPQPATTLEMLGQAVAALNPWALSPLQSIVSITGSLVIGLALLEGHVAVSQAFSAGFLDELYQAERWGEDHEAARVRTARRIDLEAAHQFLQLLPAKQS
jgi:chaperone required for assembly of F1-ATPase